MTHPTPIRPRGQQGRLTHLGDRLKILTPTGRNRPYAGAKLPIPTEPFRRPTRAPDARVG